MRPGRPEMALISVSWRHVERGGRKCGPGRRESDIVRSVSKSLVPRRWVLRGGVAGATAVSLGVLGAGRASAAGGGSGAAGVAEGAAGAARQGARSYDFNQHWLFGGAYVEGAERPGHDDSRFARVTLPHTVTRLSWADWEYAGW